MPGWIDIIIRSFIFMIILFITTKMLGKKQISELSFLEYVSGITIGSIAGEAITGLEDSMVNGAIGIFFFGGLTFLVDALSLKSKSFRDFVEGKGAVIIKDGKILEENLKKEKKKQNKREYIFHYKSDLKIMVERFFTSTECSA